MRLTKYSRSVPAIAAVVLAMSATMSGAAFAQKAHDTSPSITVLDDPATEHMRKALADISPDLAAAARWQGLETNDDGSMVADTVTIDVPWNESRLSIDRISLSGGQVSLKGVRLENGKGAFDAGDMSGPLGAFRALATFAFSVEGTAKGDADKAGNAGGVQPSQDPGSLSGSLKMSDFRLSAKDRQGGAGHFSSSWKGASLQIEGLHCAGSASDAAPCDTLALDGLTADTVEADATFAGNARLDAATISMTTTGTAIAGWSNAKALTKPFARPLDETGDAVGAAVTIKDLHFVASRTRDAAPTDTPSRIDIGNADFSLQRGESGSLRISGDLASAFSPNVVQGTSLWPAINGDTTAASPAGLLPLTAHIDASYDGGKLVLAGLKANIAGLFDADAATSMSGLTPLLDHHGAEAASSGSGGDLGKLIGVTISSLSLVMHDKGFSQLVQTAFGATPADLLRQAAGTAKPDDKAKGAASDEAAKSSDLMSLMMGGGNIKAGLKSIVKQAAVDRGAALLEQLRKTGSVDLHCTSTPQCLTLAIASTD